MRRPIRAAGWELARAGRGWGGGTRRGRRDAPDASARLRAARWGEAARFGLARGRVWRPVPVGARRGTAGRRRPGRRRTEEREGACVGTVSPARPPEQGRCSREPARGRRAGGGNEVYKPRSRCLQYFVEMEGKPHLGLRVHAGGDSRFVCISEDPSARRCTVRIKPLSGESKRQQRQTGVQTCQCRGESRVRVVIQEIRYRPVPTLLPQL